MLTGGNIARFEPNHAASERGIHVEDASCSGGGSGSDGAGGVEKVLGVTSSVIPWRFMLSRALEGLHVSIRR